MKDVGRCNLVSPKCRLQLAFMRIRRSSKRLELAAENRSNPTKAAEPGRDMQIRGADCFAANLLPVIEAKDLLDDLLRRDEALLARVDQHDP